MNRLVILFTAIALPVLSQQQPPLERVKDPVGSMVLRARRMADDLFMVEWQLPQSWSKERRKEFSDAISAKVGYGRIFYVARVGETRWQMPVVAEDETMAIGLVRGLKVQGIGDVKVTATKLYVHAEEGGFLGHFDRDTSGTSGSR